MWEYKVMELYNQLTVYYENNINGRYNKQIEETKRELDEALKRMENNV